MAKLQQAFDANQWDPTQSAGQLPLGRHKVVIEESEIKATNANDGGKLVLGLRIIEGPSTGATGNYNLNLYNKSQQAVEIAHRQLSAICHVTGVYNVQDTAQLHNIPFVVEVGNQKPTQEQEARRAAGEEVTLYTEVKKVFDVNGNAPGKKINTSNNSQPAQPPAAQAPVTQPAQNWGVPPSQPAQAPDFNVAPPSWGQQPQATQPPSQPTWGGAAPAGDKPAWAK